ncbi:MAG: alanyl-tRNA editing protein [Clostridia bacterium]|nr:alanyl-tRNA editing protein [Clostridia bacterium]
MTEKLYDSDSFLKEFTATVLESSQTADGYITILDKTAFFPEGGGQPSDIGFLNDAKVYDVQISNGLIYHYTTKQFQKGQTVTGRLDFDRRFDFMQQHSAEHIVSGIAHNLFGCENVGFHLSRDIVTLDFDKPLNKEQLLKIEKIANKKVWENVAFNCRYPDSETLKGLNYRSKKELEGEIRIVEIESTDTCACCAPHVKNAGQIGLIKLLDTEKLRGGIRIELKAGNRALEDYNLKYENVKKISFALATSQNETALSVERLLQNMAEQKSEITALKHEKIKAAAESFNPESLITAIFEDNLTVKDLQVFSDALHKAHGGIRAVFSETETGFAFAICGDDLDPFFQNFKAEFKIKGGGRNGMVQGTVQAEKTKLISFFNSVSI